MSETLRDVAVDLARRLASCEANSAYDGLAAWERRGEYLHEYMDRINAADAERTCHVSAERIDHEPTIDSLGIVYFECDRCGWGWYEGDTCCHPSTPCFCPHCGARVVDGDE